MRFLSVCSGIEAASVAWAPLGWKAVAFSEIEPFPCAVLAHHYPTTPNWGDMTKYEEWPDVSIDLICGGTPCQSFSVAGLRKGLADPRGNLMLTFGAIAAKYRPQWLVWENVPGVLSSNGGRDFGAFLGMLGQLGYGFAYRVLDAQYFGVAQRRRRVFVVGCLGDWRSAAAVLFERHSMCGDTAPSREARQTAPTIPARSTAGGGLGTDFDCDGGLIQAYGGNNQSGPIDVATARNACASASASGRMDFESETFLVAPVATAIRTANTSANGHGISDELAHTLDGAQGQCVAFDTTQITSAANRSNPKPGDPCHPLAAGAHAPAIAFAIQAGALRTNPNSGPDGTGVQADHAYTLEARAEVQAVAFHPTQDPISSTDGSTHALGCGSTGGQASVAVAYTTKLHNTGSNNAGKIFEERTTCLDANSPPPALLTSMAVRRLLPEECEKLQGFPRGYTAIPWRNKPASECPDGPRYKALGNSWAVPNVRWIGQRIEAVRSVLQVKAA